MKQNDSLDPQLRKNSIQLMNLLQGYRTTCILVSSVKTGLIEELARGPTGCDTLAQQLSVHRPSLQRLLRALQTLGVAREGASGWSLTTMGGMLLKQKSVLTDWATMIDEEYAPAWANLGECVKTGRPSMIDTFGMDAWQHRRAHPHLNASFNRIMAEVQAQTRSSLVDAFDFSDHAVLVDIGGGDGHLMAEVLRKNRHMSGIVFDQPDVVKNAGEVVSGAGVLDRCRLVGGSFLESIPDGGDIYLLQYVLHDWSDAECEAILRNCRSVMQESETLLIAENLLPETGEVPEFLVMLDLQMMVVLGGRERTRTEYQTLIESAGLKLRSCVATYGYTHLLVAEVSPTAVKSSGNLEAFR